MGRFTLGAFWFHLHRMRILHFLIRDVKTGTILFLGHIVDPRA